MWYAQGLSLGVFGCFEMSAAGQITPGSKKKSHRLARLKRDSASKSASSFSTILAQRLKLRLAEKNMSYRECAKQSELSLSTIAKLTSGERGSKPSLSTISAIANVLETTPEWLIGQEGTSLITLISALHQEAIHAIRTVVIDRHLSLDGTSKDNTRIYEFLSTRFRNAFATSLGLEPIRFHCSIKLINQKNNNVTDRKVRTLARSEVCTADPAVLRANLRKEIEQTVGMNSASAALMGCSDRRRNWAYSYNCFCCNNLENYADEYQNARDNYLDYYRAVMVFPLRWSKRGESQITVRGFLAFDSNLTDVFAKTPCTFDYEHSSAAYYKELCKSVPFHVGGIIADVLATIIVLHEDAGWWPTSNKKDAHE
ncbi:MAG: XRE family transcriptional regulator [Candidatus Bathyarchaeum sp.]|nr:MAG: XRE family transcriptional regulator [Candidatus Bathyarchaeum sp.]